MSVRTVTVATNTKARQTLLTLRYICCSGLEEVLGIQLPKDLTTDEARDTLAKLVCSCSYRKMPDLAVLGHGTITPGNTCLSLCSEPVFVT